MKFVYTVLFAVNMALAFACSDLTTTIEIQNYDGPIYLHIPAQNTPYEEPVIHTECCQPQPKIEIECTCIAKPSVNYIPINTASEHSCNVVPKTCHSGIYPGTHNPGNCNSGTLNTRHSNSGTFNTGNYNHGNCNCGTVNSGVDKSGIFCVCVPSSGTSECYPASTYEAYPKGIDKVFSNMDVAKPIVNCICHKCSSSC